jgi:hypothetical protein
VRAAAAVEVRFGLAELARFVFTAVPDAFAASLRPLLPASATLTPSREPDEILAGE